MTSSRRVRLTLAAAAAGLSAAAFLPVAVAFADDDYSYLPDPNSPEVVTASSGIPSLFSEVSGTQLFDVDDTTIGTSANPDVVSAFNADETVNQDWLGYYGQDVVVTGAATSLPDGTAIPTTFDPVDGTIFDNVSLFDTFGNALTIVPSLVAGGADSVSDTIITPFGDIPVLTDVAINLPSELLSAF